MGRAGVVTCAYARSAQDRCEAAWIGNIAVAIALLRKSDLPAGWFLTTVPPRVTLDRFSLPTNPAAAGSTTITADRLGCADFRARHGLRYAYLAGAMYKGIASRALVARMGQAGLLGFLGTGGLSLERAEAELAGVRADLGGRGVYGANFLATPAAPEMERAMADLLLRLGVPRIEAAAFTQVSPELVRLRLSGLRRAPDGALLRPRQIVAKVSRPEVAAQFLRPAPPALVEKLLAAGTIARAEAELAPSLPMADDLCVEADSGGHTDRGVAYALLPVMLSLRDEAMQTHGFATKIGVGAAGGIGTPEAVAASFILGADFVLTGSINQCSVESGASETVKDMLQEAEVQDMDIVPAGDMFEMGAKVQVFKRGLLFPGRAKKLYDLYRQFDSIEQIDARTREQIETRYFRRSFAEVYAETREFYLKRQPAVIERAERDPKHKMALIFRWYFVQSSRLALRGEAADRTDFQIHSGPALGSFNRFVRGRPEENWRRRHVDRIAELLMAEAARLLTARFRQMSGA